ncbi:phage major capsid protein, P2 family [Pseudomonas putida]|uniref:phage major capsid protein, P2 family n=1 Tax=Pseudomonas putida TaxID=303 RepID=UPI001059CACF|nr:phage major capsid protein, P2 family [Pseudomonas putida]TDJ76956.1 phage major capsid protein, P2 family [Pseudomonas putida]
MRNETRAQYGAYLDQIAKLNGVSDATKTFTVAPSVQQKLESRMQESSDFLSKIGMIGVDELKGEKIGVGVSSTIASRTDTTGSGVRIPRDVSGLDSQGYEAHQTDFDTAIRYSQLDAWARHPEFQTMLRDAILRRQALDRIMIGFNGTSAAANTNRDTNPLLQDVNIGWLQQYRDNAPARVLKDGKVAGKIVIGSGSSADYNNLDALIFDAVANLIDPWHRKDTGIVVILGSNLVHDKYFPLVNKEQAASEKLATDMILSQKRMGGKQPVEVPYVPDGAALVTSLENLAIYWQINGRRRYTQENPSKNRIENFESSNDAYVVEDYGLGCLIENIELEA